MKIKELFENNDSASCEFDYKLVFWKIHSTSEQLSESIPKDLWDDLASEIDPKLKCTWLMFTSAHFAANRLSDQELGNSNWFENIVTKLHQGAEKLVKSTMWNFEKKSSYGTLKAFGIPDKVMDYENIEITFSRKNVSLSGFNKLIGKSCLNLYIKDPESIKSNVLSLLKLPKNCDVEWELKEPWVKIVDKHLIGDRNIIACQKELYDNDLDEYAQL